MIIDMSHVSNFYIFFPYIHIYWHIVRCAYAVQMLSIL